MATNILMPALSPTMETGTLAKWLKAEGDEISAGDIIAEIETDKATMEVEAVDQGRLARIVVVEGTEGVAVNAVIAILADEGDAIDAPPHPAPAKEVLPQALEGAVVPGAQPTNKSEIVPGLTQDLVAPGKPNGDSRLFASPLARRIAAERDIDLGAITGSGPRGRIVKADLEGAAQAKSDQWGAMSAPVAPPLQPAGPDPQSILALYADRDFDELPLDNMRRTVAARLTEAKQTVPHFYLRREIRLDELLAVRQRLNARAEVQGVKISINDLIIKATALALQTVPEANAVWAGDRILRLSPSDVAVAVAVEGGLFTPVICDAETKTLTALSAEMKDLAARARARKLAPQDYQGGAFAISNLGMFGVESFDAVINPPQASILAVGAGVEKPVIRDGQTLAATMMSVTLSVDHRVIDGTAGASFLAAIVGFLEDPTTMLL